MTFLKVMTFSLAVLFTYTLFANVLPQVQSNPPAEEEPLAAGDLDMDGLIAWGERIFRGKGTCTLCHNNLGRAPDLLAVNLAKEFSERMADPRYQGAAKGATGAKAVEAYIRESMLEPSAYVVAGFGKKGSNDTVSPMPAVDKPPISLSEAQAHALIAFLEDRAGLDVTVPLPTGEAVADNAGTADSGGDEEEDGPATTAKAAIEKFTCNACHDLFGSEADTGPKLAGVGARLGRDGIAKAILQPNAEIAKGFEADIMPKDFADQMRIREFDLIVDYLMTLKAG